MTRIASFALVGLFLVLASLPLAADNVPAQPAMKVPVRVMDKQGNPVMNLKMENFTLQLDKKPVGLASCNGPESPVLIPLVFDTTGDLTYIDAIRKELVKAIQGLPPNVQLMVLTANDGLKVVQNNTGDKALLTQAITTYNTKGYPGFMENVLNVAEQMHKLQANHTIRVCPILITDSEIYRYRKQYTTADFNTEADRYESKLKETSVPLFVVRLPIGNNDQFNRNYEGAIREMVRVTGGEAEFPMGVTGVPVALSNTLRRIMGTYILGFTSPDLKPGKEQRIKVELQGAAGDVDVEYQKNIKPRK
mgnify:CR=1 FL=1